MAVLSAVVLPTTELEDHDLRSAVVSRNLRRDARTSHDRLADLRAAFATEEKHVVERDAVTGVAQELLHAEALAFGHSVLFAARLDHCVHVSAAPSMCISAGGKTRGTRQPEGARQY